MSVLKTEVCEEIVNGKLHFLSKKFKSLFESYVFSSNNGSYEETYLEEGRILRRSFFAVLAIGIYLLTIFAKSFIANARLGFK